MFVEEEIGWDVHGCEEAEGEGHAACSSLHGLV